MSLIAIPAWWQTCSIAVFLLLAHRLHRQWAVGRRRRQIMQSHGCQPLKPYASFDLTFGFACLLDQWKAISRHRHQQWCEDSFVVTTKVWTYALRILNLRIVHTADPEVIKAVLATHFHDFSLTDQRKEMVRQIGQGIFGSDGPEWQRSRDLLRPNFVKTQVADPALFESHVENLLKIVPQDGSTVDLSPLFAQFTMDVATELLLGESARSLVPGEESRHMNYFATVFDRWKVPEGIEEGNPLKVMYRARVPSQRLKDDRKFVQTFLDDYINRALENHQRSTSPDENGQPRRYVVLYELAQTLQDKDRLRSEILNILLAGRDTTAATLTNLFFELARRPESWTILQREVATHTADADARPTHEQIKAMRYLRAFINETLRLHPILPGIDRQAREDVVLPVGGGIDGKAPLFVPKGYIVAWSIYTLHRRAELYGADAHEFKPERWLDEGPYKGFRPGWAYQPFGGGPRICIGQQFAINELSYLLVRMLQTFDHIEPRDPEPWCEKMDLVVSSLNGCKVGLFAKRSADEIIG